VFTVWYGLNIYILFSSIQASKGNALIRTRSLTPERRGLSERGARQVHFTFKRKVVGHTSLYSAPTPAL
jgi:hypothetical protein